MQDDEKIRKEIYDLNEKLKKEKEKHNKNLNQFVTESNCF